MLKLFCTLMQKTCQCSKKYIDHISNNYKYSLSFLDIHIIELVHHFIVNSQKESESASFLKIIPWLVLTRTIYCHKWSSDWQLLM